MLYLEPFRGQSFWRTECRVWSAGEIYLAGDKVRGTWGSLREGNQYCEGRG